MVTFDTSNRPVTLGWPKSREQSWTATTSPSSTSGPPTPGKLDELTAIYRAVTDAMEQNEPGAEAVHVYVSEADNALYVRDEFADANAVGFHLQTTAGAHFPNCCPSRPRARSSSWARCPTS